ncbi:hypothetical protein ACFST9_09060 [Hymenobacter monticola]|uniref:DUF4259 domain-containing protein n=1 Tax=Hymenobacter monticola TaxID=1705399 RepID=A0ABY4B8Z0_9BACT|nr:hypothetical protein [Hymenobacter monticola]UOE35644.1 hypothetical protein MTP16_08335 [Hymenobacter monticola]
MGTWNTAIDGNDTFLDIYQDFFDLYNQGKDPIEVSKQIVKDYKESFDDYDDRNNSLFGLALAQWETKSLDPILYKQVKEIIEAGSDLEAWEGSDIKYLEKRKAALDKFLIKISTEKEKPKRRAKPKFDFTTLELVKLAAPDHKKSFEASEHYINGAYSQTGSAIYWGPGNGGSIFYFEGRGKFISARWIDSQTLEITYDRDIIFTKKDDTFFYNGDQGKIIYLPK